VLYIVKVQYQTRTDCFRAFFEQHPDFDAHLFFVGIFFLQKTLYKNKSNIYEKKSFGLGPPQLTRTLDFYLFFTQIFVFQF